MKKRTKFVLLGSCIVLLGGLLYGYHLFSESNPSLLGMASSALLSADSLYNDFARDEGSATRKYADKVLSVRGLVREVNKENNGGYTVYLSTPDLMKSVSCSLDRLYLARPPEIKAGDSVTMKGICTGALLDIVMVRCVIEN